LAALALQRCGVCRGALLAFGWAASLFGRLVDFGFFDHVAVRFFSRHDSGAVAAHGANHTVTQAGLEQRGVRLVGQAVLGEFSKRAREGGLAGQRLKARKAADAAQTAIHFEALDEVSRALQPPNRFGAKSPAKSQRG
jgi:hypothetical protein